MPEFKRYDEYASPEGIPEGWINYADSGKWIPPELAAEFNQFAEEAATHISPARISESIRHCEGGRIELRIRGDLDLSNNEKLTRLPSGLIVEGSLVADNCVNLTDLPYGLGTGRGASFSSCVRLTNFSEDAFFGGSLAVDGCSSLKKLPQKITLADGIFLHNSGWAQDWKIVRDLHAFRVAKMIKSTIRGAMVRSDFVHVIYDVSRYFDETEDLGNIELCKRSFDVHEGNINENVILLAKIAGDICVDSIKNEAMRIHAARGAKSAMEVRHELDEMFAHKILMLKNILPEHLVKKVIAGNPGIQKFIDAGGV